MTQKRGILLDFLALTDTQPKGTCLFFWTCADFRPLTFMVAVYGDYRTASHAGYNLLCYPYIVKLSCIKRLAPQYLSIMRNPLSKTGR